MRLIQDKQTERITQERHKHRNGPFLEGKQAQAEWGDLASTDPTDLKVRNLGSKCK